MMASSPSAVLTGQRKITTGMYVAIITIILLGLSISVDSSIHSVQDRINATVDDTVNIPFEYCGRPRPLCTLAQSFNLSAPNPACTVDRHGHCEVLPAPADDLFRQDLDNACELCVLVIHGVTQRDAGRYSICQTSGACTSSFWRNISTLKVENKEPPTPTASTSTKVSTKPTTDSTKTTKPKDLTTTNSEINSIPGTNPSPGNNALSGMKTSSAVGIPITIVILVIMIIACAVYFYKRKHRRENTPLAPGSPYANTTTVPITEGSHDGASFELAKENTHLRADPELNT